MLLPVAHIRDIASSSPAAGLAIAISVVVLVALTFEHLYVKNGRITRRQIARVVAAIAVVGATASVAPASVLAQSSDEPRGLPDLVSDPPWIWSTKDVRTPQGDVIRAMTFDGHIHNIGTGKLEISGNPQVEGGMQQRVFDGNEWTSVATPTVRFETNDGHNHFHLNRAVDYALWTDDRSEQVTDASKVGFCLVDTEQMEENYDSNYLIEDFNYCGIDDPDTTELTMGITPGWRDTYGSTVAMQWVDVSNVIPGQYWVSAITDPENQIVESNEDNNGIVFSEKRFAVDGYVARDLPVQAPGPIGLKANVYGTVGERAWVIVAAPENGTLDVPTGVDLRGIDSVRYTPDPGFTGADSFRYIAHDVSTPFPLNAAEVEVAIEVTEANSAHGDTNADDVASEVEPGADRAIVDAGPQVNNIFERVELTMTLAEGAEASDAPLTWYASNLPSGLTIDANTGAISGGLTFAGQFESTVVAWQGQQRFDAVLNWTVEDGPQPSLVPVGDFSTSGTRLLRQRIGSGTPGATYVGEGLPEGGSIVANTPMVTGYTSEVGTFLVEVQELVDGEVVASVSFNWTIRPSTQPAFPL